MSNQRPSQEQDRFIDDVAALLMPWGMAQTTARLYGYLLLREAPVSLDQIASDLGTSKSSVSVAARLLEKHQMAHRHGERGSKRVLYGPTDHHTGLLTEHSLLWAALAKLFHRRAPAVASGIALKRLIDMADFLTSVREAVETTMQQLSAQPRRARRKPARSAPSARAGTTVIHRG